MSIVDVIKTYTVYFADGVIGRYMGKSGLGACVKAREYHNAEVVYTTEGTELKYHFNGYGWDNLEAVNQRNNQLLEKANALIDAGVCTDEQFFKCCDLYNHLIHASIISIDGQWFIIDAVCDPLDYYRCNAMPFLESNAIYAHNYDDEAQGGSDQIHIIWEDLINDLLDGGMELMRVQPMKIS